MARSRPLPMRPAVILLLLGLWLCLLPGPAASEDAFVTRLLQRGSALLQQAERAQRAGDRVRARSHAIEAARLFRDAHSQATHDLRPPFFGIQAGVFAGDLKLATDWLDRYAGMTPYREKDPRLHFGRALIALRLRGKVQDAIQALERMAQLDRRALTRQRDLLHYEALDRHAVALVSDRRNEAAARQFRKAAAIAIRMGHPRKALAARANVAKALQRAQRYAEAEEIYLGLVEGDPKNPTWHFYLALCYGDQNRFPEAIARYQQTLALHKPGTLSPLAEQDVRRAALKLGNCYRVLGERAVHDDKREALGKKSKAALARYLELAPKDPLAHRWMGTLLFDLLDAPYEAEPYFRKAHELDPVCPDPLRFLIQIHTNYPAPGIDGLDEAAARAAKQAWTAPLAAWERELAENRKKREAAREARRARLGSDGCN